MKGIHCLPIALILLTGAAIGQQQKKPAPIPPPQKPVTQTVAPNAQKPQTSVAPVNRPTVLSTPKPPPNAPAPARTPTPVSMPQATPGAHPQSTVSVAQSVPQNVPLRVSPPASNGIPANIPKTTIGPVPQATQQAELLAQLKQALRVQQFCSNKLYYTIVCGPASVCPQPSFDPNQPPPSPPDGFVGEESQYLATIEQQINQQASQIIAQQGAAGAQNRINAIRNQYHSNCH